MAWKHTRVESKDTMTRRKKLRARDALLFAMKAASPTNAEARADFRDDVMWMCERWEGDCPFVWFSSKEGTAIVELPPSARPFQVKSICVRLNRITSIIGRLFVVEDDQLHETNVQELCAALTEYYT